MKKTKLFLSIRWQNKKGRRKKEERKEGSEERNNVRKRIAKQTKAHLFPLKHPGSVLSSFMEPSLIT